MLNADVRGNVTLRITLKIGLIQRSLEISGKFIGNSFYAVLFYRFVTFNPKRSFSAFQGL